MAGTVFLRTNRFEVKLESIIFKAKEFEHLCTMDFLFPKGKIWQHPPIVGIDVMRHPRDPNIVLMLLCFGVGCVILRLRAGECLSEPILNFLTDDRIHFVGFGIPEKSHLLPFEELGLTKCKSDVGYMAAKLKNNPKYAKCDLAELARKILGIKKMVGMTEASSFERYEQIKCAVCQLFLSSVIAMSLIRADNKKTLGESPKKVSFLKRFNSMRSLNERWCKIAKGRKEKLNQLSEVVDSYYDVRNDTEEIFADDHFEAKCWESYNSDNSFQNQFSETDSGDDSVHVKEGGRLGQCYGYSTDNEGGSGDDTPSKENSSPSKKPLKGILKCPSTRIDPSKSSLPSTPSSPSPLPSPSKGCPNLKRANSKGHNVTFKCDMGSL